jgi:hypothetical protein
MFSNCKSVEILESSSTEKQIGDKIYLYCKVKVSLADIEVKESIAFCTNCNQILFPAPELDKLNGEISVLINKEIISDFIVEEEDEVFNFDETSKCIKKHPVLVSEYKIQSENEEIYENLMGTSLPVDVPLEGEVRREFEPPHIYAARTFDQKSGLSSRPTQRKYSVL